MARKWSSLRRQGWDGWKAGTQGTAKVRRASLSPINWLGS